ncbi:MAG TPA: hypothetical protein VGB00_11980, partial [Pyrinomonadaceae bacterium]
MPSRKFEDLPETKTPPFEPFPHQETASGALNRRTAETGSLSNIKKSSLCRFINLRKASKKVFALTFFLAGCLSLLFLPKAKPLDDDEDQCRCETDLKTVNYNFPDSADEYKPPSWWEIPNKTDAQKFSIFKLSQNFPVELVAESCADGIRLWENFDFRTQSREYMTEVLKHAFEGNL